MQLKRREIFDAVCQVEDKVGLEIGPLNRPLVDKNSIKGKIFYLDHLSTKDLKKKYRDDSSVDVEKIVDVDFVCEDGDLQRVLGTNKFDYIIASHVVEHIPDPIFWLQGLLAVLKPNGVIFLVVPDKRFTFDYKRPVTTFGTLLDSFFSKRRIPSISSVYDHYSSALNISAHDIWSGSLNEAELIPLATSEIAWNSANKVHEEKKYYDVHVSIFTPWSFFQIIEGLVHTGLLYSEVAFFKDTEINSIEFYVGLKRCGLGNKEAKKFCLSSIPQLSFNTLLSPYMPQVKALSGALDIINKSHLKLNSEYNGQEARLRGISETLSGTEKELKTANELLSRRSVSVILKLVHLIFKIKRFFCRGR
ncbi:class I SAM-dependent methyltransferase [Rhodospirillaceae bacterium]|nr:class I SAM-dependent methyltransferase [Rhodospirillaceae bacterium]